MTTRSIHVADPAAMRNLGSDIAGELVPGEVVLLHGDLGAGKTTLAQGIARGLGIHEPIQSPTFTIVEEHAGRLPDGTPISLHHLDLYRLGGPDDLESFGWEDYITPLNAITIIEWPERAGDWLPDRFILITIDHAAPGGRQVEIRQIG